MDAFWLNPPHPNDPAATTRLWDAVIAYMQPPAATRYVRPLRRARIVLATSSGADIVPAVWGLVPEWAAAAERRSVALRHALLDGELAPASSMLRDIWSKQQPAQRCLIPASGWTAAGSCSRLAFSPELGPVTFAGLQTIVRADGREPVYSFGVLYRVMSIFPYDGSRVPVIVRPEDRHRWLTGASGEAQGLLRPPGMKVVAQRVHDGGASDRVLYGPDYVDRDVFAVP